MRAFGGRSRRVGSRVRSRRGRVRGQGCRGLRPVGDRVLARQSPRSLERERPRAGPRPSARRPRSSCPGHRGAHRRKRHHSIERWTMPARATRLDTPSLANTCLRCVFTVCGEHVQPTGDRPVRQSLGDEERHGPFGLGEALPAARGSVPGPALARDARRGRAAAPSPGRPRHRRRSARSAPAPRSAARSPRPGRPLPLSTVAASSQAPACSTRCGTRRRRQRPRAPSSGSPSTSPWQRSARLHTVGTCGARAAPPRRHVGDLGGDVAVAEGQGQTHQAGREVAVVVAVLGRRVVPPAPQQQVVGALVVALDGLQPGRRVGDDAGVVARPLPSQTSR